MAAADSLFELRMIPSRGDPMSKYIKIESIGRMGTVDENDPTTMGTQSERLRSEKVAYKSIGITDYARFVTNKDRRSDEFSLGTAGFTTNFGEYDVNGTKGAPIRVNGDLLWHGKSNIWLNSSRGDGGRGSRRHSPRSGCGR